MRRIRSEPNDDVCTWARLSACFGPTRVARAGAIVYPALFVVRTHRAREAYMGRGLRIAHGCLITAVLGLTGCSGDNGSSAEGVGGSGGAGGSNQGTGGAAPASGGASATGGASGTGGAK